MVLTTTGAAPDRAAAERAAAALADAGVARVVLFGSVASGDAGERSDIDLLAIYDDLEYTQRWERRWELASAAAAAAGHPIDVVVTDRPEWKVRTERVNTSLESRAAHQGVILVDRPPGVVNWDKEMVMPVDEYQVRLLRACGEAHGVVEASIKPLIHLAAAPGAEAWGHDIAEVCDQLVEPHRSALVALLKPHNPEGISRRHVLARYQAEGHGPAATPEMVTELTRTACRIATYVTDRFPDNNPTVVNLRWRVGLVEDYLDGYDLATGQPHGR